MCEPSGHLSSFPAQPLTLLPDPANALEGKLPGQLEPC